MIWQDPNFLWFLLLIPILAIAYWLKSRFLHKKRTQFFGNELFEQLRKGFWKTGNTLKLSFSFLGILLLIIALAGPKIGTEVREMKRQGIDMVIALDLSLSMKAEDVKPSRLDKAKFEINRLIERLKGDRVGLVVFTGEAYVQSPMTLDYSALRLFLDIADTDQMPSTTTDFKAAMEVAKEAFKTPDENAAKDAAKVLLIISDGEDHGQNFDEELNMLIKQNIFVYTLGIGTEQGAAIPMYDKNSARLVGYKRDRDGNVVTTALESELLKQIAAKAEGKYYSIERGNDGIDSFLAEIDKLEKGEFSNQEYADFKNQYRWPGIFALVFLSMAYFMPTYKKN